MKFCSCCFPLLVFHNGFRITETECLGFKGNSGDWAIQCPCSTRFTRAGCTGFEYLQKRRPHNLSGSLFQCSVKLDTRIFIIFRWNANFQFFPLKKDSKELFPTRISQQYISYANISSFGWRLFCMCHNSLPDYSKTFLKSIVFHLLPSFFLFYPSYPFGNF